MSERDPILVEAFSRRGAVKAVAAACGIRTAAVSQWRRVPEKRLEAAAGALGIPEHQLRPDICPPPPAAQEAASA